MPEHLRLPVIYQARGEQHVPGEGSVQGQWFLQVLDLSGDLRSAVNLLPRKMRLRIHPGAALIYAQNAARLARPVSGCLFPAPAQGKRHQAGSRAPGGGAGFTTGDGVRVSTHPRGAPKPLLTCPGGQRATLMDWGPALVPAGAEGGRGKGGLPPTSHPLRHGLP